MSDRLIASPLEVLFKLVLLDRLNGGKLVERLPPQGVDGFHQHSHIAAAFGEKFFDLVTFDGLNSRKLIEGPFFQGATAFLQGQESDGKERQQADRKKGRDQPGGQS
ncbi:MAG: hypothetical protein FD149_2520 [Rhodospirillaceae bacterium]|nr:MAG: hypothetical protein FD149_2520 [Rhodospirillaceae bacterium]